VTIIMVVSVEYPPIAVAASGRVPRGGRLLDPLAVAVLAGVVSAVAAGRPSLWFDEGATVSAAAGRSLPELWRLIGHVDAVHGVYYLLMHGWFALFPATEFWSRVPSCLAVAAAAAGVVVLTKQFSSRATALCAGVVFAILPRVTWAGVEARCYAFSAVASVWLTVLLVASIRRNRWWLWLLYALTLTVSVLLNIYLVLLVPAYAACLPAIQRRNSVLIRWAVASGAAVGVTMPFLVFAHGQLFQVGWISPLNWHNVIDVAQHQYFDNSVPFGLLVGVVIVGAIAVRHPGVTSPGGETGRLIFLCAAWIAVPTAISVVYSVISEPVYHPRYLTFTAPAMAAVLAVCIGIVAGKVTRKPWAVAAALTVLAVAAVPNYLLSQRTTYAKQGWDYSRVADVIASHAAPGDCLLIDNTVRWAPGPIRALLATRPAAFAPLADVGRGGYGPDRATLWDGHVAVWLVLPRLDKCTTVWTISSRDPALPHHQSGRSLPPGPLLGRAPAYQFSGELGFRIVERWQFHRAQVVKSAR
jgi:mannosyltransferase